MWICFCKRYFWYAFFVVIVDGRASEPNRLWYQAVIKADFFSLVSQIVNFIFFDDFRHYFNHTRSYLLKQFSVIYCGWPKEFLFLFPFFVKELKFHNATNYSSFLAFFRFHLIFICSYNFFSFVRLAFCYFWSIFWDLKIHFFNFSFLQISLILNGNHFCSLIKIIAISKSISD